MFRLREPSRVLAAISGMACLAVAGPTVEAGTRWVRLLRQEAIGKRPSSAVRG